MPSCIKCYGINLHTVPLFFRQTFRSGKRGRYEKYVAMMFSATSQLRQIIGELTVVFGAHSSERLSTDNTGCEAFHIERPFWCVRSRCEPEPFRFWMPLHQKISRLHRSKIGEGLIHLLDNIQWPIFQWVRPDRLKLKEFHRFEGRAWKRCERLLRTHGALFDAL